MILNDVQIIKLCNTKNMIYPFIDEKVSTVDGGRIISYGLSSFGYDIRIIGELRLLQTNKVFLDPKDETTQLFVKTVDFIIPANSGALTSSVEYFKLPNNITGICIGKSTYARCGLIVNITPLEAGWEGNLTIELVNTNPFPIKIYPYEGIAQILFFEGTNSCKKNYLERGGKYQEQIGVTGAIV